MDDYMLVQLLKNKNMSDREFMEKFKDFLETDSRYSRGGYPRYNREGDAYDRGYYNRGMGRYDKSYNEEHFDSSYAEYLVANMYHYDGSKKLAGEKFSMSKAQEVKERYKGMLPQDVTSTDIYVAINAQYHDYCALFKSWFGDNIDQKIIESAIVFWFKDEDYTDGSKIVNYFERKAGY